MNKRQAKKRAKKERTRKKSLLKSRTTKTGYTKYGIKPSEVRDAELKYLAKKANDRLYKMEKAGVTDKSREYRMVEHYAIGDPSGKGSIYNVDVNKGRIRFTSTSKGMSGEERAYLINTIRNFLKAETSTVSGTKRAFKRAYTTFMKNNGSKINMTQEQYENVWSTYRDMVEKDKLSNEGYNAFMELVTKTDLYTMKQWQIREAISYIDKSDALTTSGKVADVIENMGMENNIKIEKVGD